MEIGRYLKGGLGVLLYLLQSLLHRCLWFRCFLEIYDFFTPIIVCQWSRNFSKPQKTPKAAESMEWNSVKPSENT